MWGPMNNVKFLKYANDQMRRENRPILANICVTYDAQLELPFVDVFGIESNIADTVAQDMGLARAIWGPKPISFLLLKTGLTR